jgi:hypothetical protein
MHAAIAALVRAASAVTPSPSPTAPPPELVTPGPWGFAVIAFIALAVVLLVWDMLRRIRRGRFRSEIREELDAEELAAEQADAAVRASDVDDQDIDPTDDPKR